MIINIPDNWLATSENINALPRPLRKYIHDLHTNCDPAGMVRENVLLRERVAQLERMLEEAPEGFVVGQSGPDHFFGRHLGAIVQMSDPASVKGKRVKLVVVDE